MVIDSVSKKGVEDVSIYVYNKIQKTIAAAFKTDSSGFATIIIDNYSDSSIILELYRIGYRKKIIYIYNHNKNDFIRIFLAPSIKELKSVIIKGINSPITFSNNVIVYNLKSIPNYENMTILDALNYLPFLSVKGNIVKMMGQPVVILINNKPHPFYSNPQNLNSLPPQAIEKIELNFVPSARYGKTKIMNIILKKDYFLGWTGNFNTGVNPQGFSPSGSLGYWTNKFGFNVSANYNYGTANSNGSSISQSYQNNVVINQSQQTRDLGFSNSLFASAFYNIDSLSTVDFQWVNSNDKSKTTTDANINYKDSGGLADLQNSEYKNSNTDHGNTISLNYTHKFVKPNREFYVLSQFNNSPSNSNSNIILDSATGSTNEELSRQFNSINNRSTELTFEALFQNNTNDKFQYTFGSKWIDRWNESNMELDTKYYNPYSDKLTEGYFKYLQTVSSTYLDATIKLKKKLTLNAGLKFEYVVSTLTPQDKQTYKNFIPDISLTYNYNSSNVFSLSYTRNILRPGFNFLLPFSIIQNAYLLDSGNVNLKPQNNNDFGIQYYGYSKKLQYGLAIDYSNISNFIDEFYTSVPSGGIVKTSSNSQYNGWSLSFNIEIPITSRIRFSHFSSGSIIQQIGQGYTNKQISGYINEKVFYNLAKNQRIYLSTIAFSPNLNLQGKEQSMAYWNTKIAYSYFFSWNKNPTQLGLSLNNPWLIHGLPGYSKQRGENFYYYSRAFHSNSIVSIQLVINFKGKKYRESSFDRSKSIQNNDIKKIK